MAYNKQSGMYEGFIYLITNNVNGKQYVGQTNRTVDFRFQQHQYRSTKAKYTQPIYSAFKKYGIDSFSVEEVCKLEAVTKEQLTELLNEQEIIFIDKYNSKVPNGYNVLSGGNVNPTYLTAIKIYQFDTNGKLLCVFDSISECIRFLGLHGEATLKKHIRSRTLYKGYYWSFEDFLDISLCNGESLGNKKPVFQFDLEGKLIKRHLSASHVNEDFISKYAIQMACIKSPHVAKGFIWLYTDVITKKEIQSANDFVKQIQISEKENTKTKKDKIKPNIEKSRKHNNSLCKEEKTNNKKSVYQFSLDAIFIKKWDSETEASLFITEGRSSSALWSVLTGKCSQAHGYLWSYTETPPDKYKTRIEKFGKKVNKYDLDFNYICTYDSAIEASLSVGSKCYQSISGCCNGVTHHSFGYIWRYVGENDNNPNLYYEKMGYMQSVDMFDLNGNYQNTYDDMINISEKYSPSLILRCCEGKIKKAHNHIWKFNNKVIKSA